VPRRGLLEQADPRSDIVTVIVERPLIRLPSTTHGSFTKMPPTASRSKRHFGTVAIRRPRTQSAYAGISTPWQTLAIGLPVSKKCRVMRTRSSS
jgi:hypothetical protein